jgi:hypothetical protein
MFGYSQIDRVVPAVAAFEVNLGFVSRTDRPTVRKRSSRIGRNRERQTFADQLGEIGRVVSVAGAGVDQASGL